MVFEEIFDEVLKNNEDFGKQQRGDGPKERYSPTDLGGCQRKLAFQFFKSPENDNTDDDKVGRRVLALGNVIHDHLQKILNQSFKELKSEMYFRVPIDKENEDIIFSGYCDSLMFHEKHGIIALEFKSINGFAFKYVQDEPKEDHKSQLNMYLHYFGVDKGVIVYYDKNTSQIKEHKIKYDKELALKDIQFIVNTQRIYIDRLVLPEKPVSFTKSAFPCSYCKFSEICYGGKEWKSNYYEELVKQRDKKEEEVKKLTEWKEEKEKEKKEKVELSGEVEDFNMNLELDFDLDDDSDDSELEENFDMMSESDIK